MLPLRELFDLVKSLSKTEKRYFRVKLGERAAGAAYFELYRLLEQAESYDDRCRDELEKRFSKQQLEITRKHLYRVLMRALRDYHGQADEQAVLWEKYSNAKLLFERGFGVAGMRHVVQGREVAQKKGYAHLAVLFSKLELEYGAAQKFADWEEEQLIEIHEKMRACMQEEEVTREHASLYEILLCRYWKNGVVRNHRQRAQLNDMMLEEHHIMASQRKGTFQSGQLHLHFQSVYFMMTGDLEGSLKAFYALDDFFRENAAEWAAEPANYIRFLQDVLETLRRFGRFDEMAYFVERLGSVHITSQSLRSRVSLLLSEQRLYIALANEQDIAGMPIAWQPGGREEQPALQDLIQWWFTVARAHFVKKNYQESLQLVNRLLQIQPALLGKINYSKVRVLNLMIHHALQNRDYLYYEIRSFERKMKKGEAWHQTEKLVVDYLKHWLAYKPFTKSKGDIMRSLEDPYEQVMVSELGLKKWLKFE